MTAVLFAFAWLQHDLWKKDAETAKPAARPRILFVENRLILSAKENEPLRLAFGVMNNGNADATVTFKDQTYYLGTDPSQKSFKHQTFPPEEFVVAAVPNAIYRSEMRFDFLLTPEKLAALNSGKARLFFFARGEYRDESTRRTHFHFLPCMIRTFRAI